MVLGAFVQEAGVRPPAMDAMKTDAIVIDPNRKAWLALVGPLAHV